MTNDSEGIPCPLAPPPVLLAEAIAGPISTTGPRPATPRQHPTPASRKLAGGGIALRAGRNSWRWLRVSTGVRGGHDVMRLRNRNAGLALAPPFEGHGPDGAERATFAAGCFWGVEAAFRQVHGVLQTAAGYTGGHVPDPSYGQVGRHRTGHAEAVEVWFDPAQVSYAELLE